MIPSAIFIAALILLVAVGLMTWVWFAMALVEGELRSFIRFEAKHFEIGPQAQEHPERARWPIPG